MKIIAYQVARHSDLATLINIVNQLTDDGYQTINHCTMQGGFWCQTVAKYEPIKSITKILEENSNLKLKLAEAETKIASLTDRLIDRSM